MPFSEYGGDQPSDWWRLESWWDVPPGSSGQRIKPELVLRQVAPNRFQLVRGFRYALPADDEGARISRVKHAAWYVTGRRKGEPCPTEGSSGPWDVPPHDLRSDPKNAENSTDIASVPSWLWWFIASHGRHSRAALLHDRLIGPENDDVTDKQADHVFRMALRDSGVPVLRRWLMWNAVSLASLWRTGLGKCAVVLFALHVVIFIGALAATTNSSWGWLGGALAFAAGLVIWRKRWLITLVGLALIALPTIAVFTSYALAFVAEGTLYVLAKAASVLPEVEVPEASTPVLGRPYRQDFGRM